MPPLVSVARPHADHTADLERRPFMNTWLTRLAIAFVLTIIAAGPPSAALAQGRLNPIGNGGNVIAGDAAYAMRILTSLSPSYH